jgi:hypothetical protein
MGTAVYHKCACDMDCSGMVAQVSRMNTGPVDRSKQQRLIQFNVLINLEEQTNRSR